MAARGWPGDDTYRGPAPFSQPETQVVARLRTFPPRHHGKISFHTYAELILYPYGYTYDDLPADMDPRRLRDVPQAGGATWPGRWLHTPAGQRPVHDGRRHGGLALRRPRRIFAFTFEMYPRQLQPRLLSARRRQMARETRRNNTGRDLPGRGPTNSHAQSHRPGRRHGRARGDARGVAACPVARRHGNHPHRDRRHSHVGADRVGSDTVSSIGRRHAGRLGGRRRGRGHGCDRAVQHNLDAERSRPARSCVRWHSTRAPTGAHPSR